MAKTSEVYKADGKTYHPDTCGPVVQAVESGRLRYQALARGGYHGRRLGRGALPGVKLIGFWDADQSQDWGLDWHRNEGIELTFLETGSLNFALDSQEFRLEPDDLTIARPWQPHRVGDPRVDASRLHFVVLDVGVRQPHQSWKWPPWLVFSKADRLELINVLRNNDQPVWHADGEIRRCFARIARAVKTDADGSSISLLAAYLNELFVLVLEMFRHQDVKLDESLSTTRRTVELFWSDLTGSRANLALPWTLQSMAKRCGLGVTQFAQHTKQLTNMTPARFLGRCRLESSSKLLLDEPKMSVTEVALVCGFCTGQHFATLFRRHFGCSPRAFRINSAES